MAKLTTTSDTSNSDRPVLEKILLCNIQGLYPPKNQTKVKYLGELSKDNDYLIPSPTETHLSEEIKDEELRIENYTLYRTDRKDRTHGGIALYLRYDVAPSAKILCSFSDSKNELLIVRVPKVNIIMVTVYRPPNSDHEKFSSILGKITEKLEESETKIIMLGNFNLSIISWPSRHICGGTTSDQTQANELIKLADNHHLEQIIMKPTRMNNVLDLIFTNDDGLIHSTQISKTIISDHSIIEVHTIIAKSEQKKQNLPIHTERNLKT